MRRSKDAGCWRTARSGRVKLELGVCRGKALHDKRDALKQKALRRDMERGDI